MGWTSFDVYFSNLFFYFQFSHFQITYEGKLHQVEIIDTAGQEEFTSFLDSSLSTGDAFMILYAINSLSSWNDLKTLRSKIFHGSEGKNAGHRIPMIIVGNKKVTLVKNYYKDDGWYLRLHLPF